MCHLTYNVGLCKGFYSGGGGDGGDGDGGGSMPD
jgi:hypothetical protein